MTVKFGINSTKELLLTYEIGKGRAFEYPFFSDCKSNTNVDNGVFTVNPTTSTGVDGLHNQLTLGYNFNKSAIAASNIWNKTSSKIQFCQKLQLKEGAMVITEDIREIDVDFDFDVNFNLTNELGAATVNAANGSTSVGDCVKAFQCDGADFKNDTSALLPNQELFVCIMSVSSDVEIDKLDSMVSILVVQFNYNVYCK